MDLQLVPCNNSLIKVDREMYSRDNIFAAMDCRKQYIILSQRLCHTAEAIGDLTGETAAVSSLYECSRRLTRKGRINSFSIVKLTPGETPAWLEENRKKYDEIFISTTQPCKWVTLPSYRETTNDSSLDHPCSE